MIEILAPGPLTTVQDRGRRGFAALGVGRSGAADRGALALANRLVGNPADAAGLEVTLGGLHLRTTHHVLVAVAGAVTPIETPAGRSGFGMAMSLEPGSTLRLGKPDRGLRTYVAVRGGLDVPPVLGSRSTDTLAGLGPSPLRAGDRLPVGPVGSPDAGFAEPSGELAPPRPLPDPTVLRVLTGPRDDWTELRQLTGGRFTVRPDSDRIGVRLDGPVLPRRPGELEPEGMVRGGIQLPPDGRPIVLHADHPVTGGYPVVAVVVDADLDLVGQLRPGDAVRFRLLGADEAPHHHGVRSRR